MDFFTQFDGNLLIGIQHALNADWLTPVMKGITLLAENGIILILLCLAMILYKRTRRLGIICASALLFTFIACNLCLKPLIDRVRPWVTFQMVNPLMPPLGDGSFPSGHTTNFMGTAWAMFLATMPVKTDAGRCYDAVKCLGWKGEGVSARVMHRISVVMTVLGVLVGFSRLYLGMHYPSDVICGLLLGILIAALVYKAILRAEDKRGPMDSWLPIDQERTK